MPPIAKENELLTAAPESVARPTTNAVSGEAPFKQQPVALEVSVTVNGARAVEGSDKREPFSENTKTVLIFGNGAVIRLSSSVAPGQLLFLTNEKTKKEVVCQVVKSKNYRNVSGYVELEFTESVVGFWGMRFPGDRLAAASSPAAPAAPAFESPAAGGVPPVSPTAAPGVEASALRSAPGIFPVKLPTTAPRQVEEPATVKPVAPVAQITPAKLTSFDPEAALSAAPIKPVPSVSPAFDAPRSSDAQASIFAPPPQASAASTTIEAVTFSAVSDAKLAAPSVVDQPQAPNPESEALKQHTARLQEQLSSLLFENAAPAPPAAERPAAMGMEPAAPAHTAASILEMTESKPTAGPAKLAEPLKLNSLPAKSSLDEEELQIPAWLEPLARNAAAPSSTQDLIEREKAKRLAETAKLESRVETVEEIATEIVPPVESFEDQQVSELKAPTFGNTLSFEQNLSTEQAVSKRSGKGLLFAAIAASVLLLAGGAWWYLRPQSSDVAASATAPATPSTQAAASAASVPAESLQPASGIVQQASSRVPTIAADHVEPNMQSKPVQNSASLTPPSGSAPVAHNDKAGASSTNGGGSPVTVASAQPAAAPAAKKPSLGDVRLATPTVRKQRSTKDNAEADAALALSSDQPESNNEAVAAGLGVNMTGPAAPAAPVPVGGDVKPAKLLSSAPPVYPTLAKNQHVSGNVLIDALIDANGRVTTMKVVSGPTLLHQAAMDALKQWKYQPAMLDGKPVPMHLTVTLQFRLQ
jgi:protein TonB